MPIFTPHEATSWKDIIGEEKASQLAVYDSDEPKYENFAEFRKKAYAGFETEKPVLIGIDFSHEKSIAEIFETWMVDRGYLADWLDNYNRDFSIEKLFTENPSLTWIDRAFKWDETAEGDDYWRAVHKQWQKYLTEDIFE